MSLSQSNQLFLLDENVRAELFRFLKIQNIDAKLLPKGTTDLNLAAVSKKEKRILITNDDDFTWYRKDNIYGVILLQLPQSNPEQLIISFTKLLKETEPFAGKLIILRSSGYKIINLGDKLDKVDRV